MSPNLTASHSIIAPAWVEEPSDRGTWNMNILNSCSFTLVLCVYSAIHLNIPGHYNTRWQNWRRQVDWAAIAIFGPEIVVYVAFEQWYLARRFLKELKEIADDSKDEKFKVCQCIQHTMWSSQVIGVVQPKLPETSLRHGLCPLCRNVRIRRQCRGFPQFVEHSKFHNLWGTLARPTRIFLQEHSD